MQEGFNMQNVLEKCPVCQFAYERVEQSLPRLLSCGHSVCSQCIKDSLAQKKQLQCPVCLKLYRKNECRMFQINMLYLDMVDQLQQNLVQIDLNKSQMNQQNGHIFDQNQNYAQSPSQLFHNQNGKLVFGKGAHNASNNLQYHRKCQYFGCAKRTSLQFCSNQCQHEHKKQSNTPEKQNRKIIPTKIGQFNQSI